MKVNIRKTLFLIVKGGIIGIANIIPGVSGGTLAVVLGIYDRLIAAISGFFTQPDMRWAHFRFLAKIFTGAAVFILLLANLMDYMLNEHYSATMFLFSGLIIGGIPAVIRSHHDMKPGYRRAAMLAAGALFIVLLPESVNDAAVSSGVISSPAPGGYLLLALGGFLAGGAMIVPGVSGSFILLILGQYENIVKAIKGFDIVILAIVGIGAVLGIVVFSRMIYILLKKFPAFTYYFILGLIAGSLVRIFPGVPGSVPRIFIAFLAAAAGFITAFAISIRESEK